MKKARTEERKSVMPKSTKKRFVLLHWDKVVFCLMIYDILAMCGAYFFALWLRFDCNFLEIPGHYLWSWMMFSPIYALFGVSIFWLLRVYHSIWRFASYTELKKVFIASGITALFHTVCISILFQRMPVSYYLIGAGVQFTLILFVRFAYRFVNLERQNRAKSMENEKENRIMLIGAGAAGQMVLRDLHNAKELHNRVYCIIDDNPNK